MPELSPLTIYLIFTAPDLKPLFGVVGGALLAATLFLALYAIIEDAPGLLRWVKVTVPAAVIFAVIAILIPTTKTLIAMYGIPALVEGAKAAAVSEVGQKSYRAVNKLLDEYLAEKK